MSGTTAPPTPVRGSSPGKFDLKADGLRVLKYAAFGAAAVFVTSLISQIEGLEVNEWWIAGVLAVLRLVSSWFSDTRTALKVLVAFSMGALLCSSPAIAGTKMVKDVQGHKYLVDEATAITPGAGSGLGAIVGDAADTTALYVQHDWDITAGFEATGTDGEEVALASLTASKYLNKNMKLGLEVGRPDLSVAEVISFAPILDVTMFTDPTDAWFKGLQFKLFSWNQSTGENELLDGGALSWEVQAAAYAGFPMEFGALKVKMGLKRTLTMMAEDVPDKTQIVGGFAIDIWAVRP